MNRVIRAGETVRRPMGPWSPAVHALLLHLEAVGFDGAPRLLDVDEDKQVEVLTYLPGVAGIPPLPEVVRTDEALVGAARLVRRFHDAVASFVAPPDAAWQFMEGGPRDGDVVCHNDIAAYNLIYRDGLPQELIDWDFAAPAPRAWDVARAAWYLVPLHTPPYNDQVGWGRVDIPRRLRLLCDAYGLEDRVGFIDLIARRQAVTFNTIDAWGSAGVPGFVDLMNNPPPISERPDLPYLQQHHEEWQKAIM